MDHNEAACGACRRIGELICCEGCVAAFHLRCAGYDNASEVSHGDWYCWFCSKNKNLKYQHPNALFKPPRTSQTHVMLAMDDDTLDKFHRCQLVAVSEGYVELKYIDIKHDTDIIHRSSNRLWHGTIDKNAWSIEADGVTWRPNSRLFELDTEALNTGRALVARPFGQQRLGRDSRPQTSSTPAATAGGIQRVPKGEVGAGLPVIRGGAGEDEFTSALNNVWSNLLGAGYPDRMPQCLLMPGHLVDPWHLWREVWAWGGPDAITEHKLWATVGFSFNAPFTSPAASSRVKKSYDLLIAPLDQVVDAGDLQLQRPTKSRLPKHRALQIRAAAAPGGSSAAVSAPLRRAGSGQGRGKPTKRKRGEWSSSDDDNPAPDFASDYEGDDEDSSDAASGSADDGEQEEDSSEQEEEEQSGSGAEDDTGLPPVKQARVAAGMRASSSAGVGRGRQQATADNEVMGKVILTPAALQIKVGHLVDFRRISSVSNCATGWRSGTVVAVEPGSAWEGGRWLLIRPRHHQYLQHTHHHQQQGVKAIPDTPAATALAAATAAGIDALDEAAQKLLTPAGHVRREVAGLMAAPARPGSPAAGKPTVAGPVAAGSAGGAGGVGGASTAAGAVGSADADKPAWVPMVWRGPHSQPFPRPVVMVRPHYAPACPAAAAGQSKDSSRLLLDSAQQQQGPGMPAPAPSVSIQQQRPQVLAAKQPVASVSSVAGISRQQLSAGTAVEVLRDGSWWPATIMAVKGPSSTQEAGSSTSAAPGLPNALNRPQVSEQGLGSAATGIESVVLKNDDAPEADAAVWRCSSGHAMRPAPPQQASGYGMLLSKRENLLPLAVLRKQLQPYTYAGNIQAFSCLHYMRPEFGKA